ncbi:MAG TPA: hypothetical protein VFW28_06380 [Micropepsaceae bacterium]|nr:hypothetical protein [Micropepsaceae bacterium]
MIFPVQVLGFARTAITRYNSEGSEESADYEIDQPDAQAAVTVYVFPAPADIASALASNLPRDQVADALYMIAEQLFGDEEEAIQALHPGAELLDEGDTTITEQGKQFPGNYAAYRYDENAFGKRQRVDSKLYLFPMVAGKWMVKFRITAADANGTAQAEKFIRTLPWTIHNLTTPPAP